MLVFFANGSRVSSRLKKNAWRGAKDVGSLLALTVFVAFSFFPVLWLLFTSLKSNAELFQFPITYLPHSVIFKNYHDVFGQNPFGRFLLNSVIVTGAAVFMNITIASLTGYALGRLRLKYHNVIMLVILVFSMLPTMSVIVPLFRMLNGMGWVNTYQGLIGPYVTFSLPLSIIVLTTFFRQIPKELEEAALIDGSSRLGALTRVIAPLAAPGVVTAAILAAITIWTDFVIAMTLTSSQAMRTITVGIVLYPGEYAFPWGIISAASILAVVPLVLFILFAQRWIIEGLTAGAIKG